MARVAPANQEVVVSKEDDSSTADPAASNVSSDDRVGDMHQIKTITTDFPPKTSMKTQESPNAINNANDASSKFIVKKLKELYHNHVLEAEKRYHLHFNFDLPTDGAINDSEFDASPMVLLIGQYSTGKTTFVSHLLGEDFPGMHIGPEPTTDKFMALFYGGDKNNDGSDETSGKYSNGFPKKTRGMQLDDDSVRSIATDGIIDARGRLVKGNTLTVTPTLPFSSLSQFGSAFLNHFVGSSSSSPLLKRITFIDTPGVLSGEKQRINRTYDFAQVAKWFADRSDLILLLFDAHKLDISDEFKNVIDTIRHYNDDKIRCVLNKADAVTREQLVRVYGSLMWSMGKIFDSPEVVRVYTGSYWNGALINSDFEYMFEKDEQLLVQELVDLPRCAAERKVNQIVNRIRLVKVHVCILGTLRGMTPSFFGKRKSREHIMNNLHAIMENVRVQFDLSKGDMPDPNDFAKCLENFADFSVFPTIDNTLIRRLDRLIEEDIPEIVNDAEVVRSEVRMGHTKKVKMVEEAEDSDEDKSEEQSQEEPGKVSRQVPEDAKQSNPFRRFFLNILAILIALLLIAESAHLFYFNEFAHNPTDLIDGCSKIVKLIQTQNPPGPPFEGSPSHPKTIATKQASHTSSKVSVELPTVPTPSQTYGSTQDEL